MKRISQGKTYNTDTSTLIHSCHNKLTRNWGAQRNGIDQMNWAVVLAEGLSAENEAERWTRSDNGVPEYTDALFVTRGGDYFLHLLIQQEIWFERIKPLKPAEAKSWLKDNGGTEKQIRSLFGQKGGQKEKVITLRIPEYLKRRLESCVAKEDKSLNQWLMRKLELIVEAEEQSTTNQKRKRGRKAK